MFIDNEEIKDDPEQESEVEILEIHALVVKNKKNKHKETEPKVAKEKKETKKTQNMQLRKKKPYVPISKRDGVTMTYQGEDIISAILDIRSSSVEKTSSVSVPSHILLSVINCYDMVPERMDATMKQNVENFIHRSV